MIAARFAKGGSISENLLDLVSVAVSAVVVLAITSGTVGLLREIPVLVFTLFVPGHAILRALPDRVRPLAKLESSRSVVVMPMLLSLSLTALVASVALWTDAWHPYVMFAFEAEASFVLIAAGHVNRMMQ